MTLRTEEHEEKAIASMEINFFRPSERGLRNVGDNEYKIIFTEKPKGIRMNAFMARKLFAHGVRYVEIGVTNDGTTLIIKPTYQKEGSFAVAGTKSSAQISAAEAFAWAEANGLVNKRITGDFDPNLGAYLFDLSGELEDSNPDEEESDE